MQRWDQASPGVLRLPSGRVVPGRGLRRDIAQGADPESGLYLWATPPPPMSWSSRWVWQRRYVRKFEP